MSPRPKRERPRLRYRFGIEPPRRRVHRTAGGTTLHPSDYSVAIDIPLSIPITELELRAVEILLGNDIKELLAMPPDKSLKYRRK